jgi:hypothetical protein
MIVKIQLEPMEVIKIIDYFDKEGYVYDTWGEAVEMWVKDQILHRLEDI